MTSPTAANVFQDPHRGDLEPQSMLNLIQMWGYSHLRDENAVVTQSLRPGASAVSVMLQWLFLNEGRWDEQHLQSAMLRVSAVPVWYWKPRSFLESYWSQVLCESLKTLILTLTKESANIDDVETMRVQINLVVRGKTDRGWPVLSGLLPEGTTHSQEVNTI